MPDKVEIALPDHIKELVKKSESIDFSGGRDFRDTPEIKADLVNTLGLWRKTLIPNAPGGKGQIVRLEDHLNVVLPAKDEIVFSATRETRSQLLIPVVDGLRIQLDESDYTIRIEDYVKGGSKIVLRQTDGKSMRTATFNFEAHKRSMEALDAGDGWEHAMAANKSVVNSTVDHLVLNREFDPSDQWRKIMRRSDSFRIDSITGGLITAQCWGIVKLSVS
jgi:hypothetical protein